MAEVVEGGASLAWRLLATLEGGSIILAASALLAYTARNRAGRRAGKSTLRRPVHSVLVTNTSNQLGKELKQLLESRGCVVSTLMSGAEAEANIDKVDALVVVGAESTASGLDGIAALVSKDVYENLKLLDLVSSRVHRNGYIAWACAGAVATNDTFRRAAEAFDTTIQASLQHAANASHCEPIWVGRCDGPEQAAERIVNALLPCTTHHVVTFSIRNAAFTVTKYIGRWLKIAS